MRAAIYARYSTDLQSEASIDDQVRLCRKLLDEHGWNDVAVYSDAAISGASTIRPGYQKMLEDARSGTFDILVAEALDRLSRDQEDIAGLYKQLTFAGIRLVTRTEGEINELHVGLKGTMNALYIKDLAEKTRRGLEGRVRQGRSGGGNAYGYDVVRRLDAKGEPIRGERRINKTEAAVVNRIFEAFAAGRSPRAIALDLNRERIPGPSGKDWGASTIHGNWRRGTGILNNELYIGHLVWNRLRYIKDPSTGKRISRPNPESDWIVEEVPDLRIVDDELWQRVKERQQSTAHRIAAGVRTNRPERARRPRYLLSGLLKCGACGSGYAKVSQHHYGCSAARNKGTCGNRRTIRRDVVEATVLEGLKENLMHPDCVREFVREFHREANRLAATEDAAREQTDRDLAKAEKEIANIVEAIKSGISASALRDELVALEAKKTELEQSLEAAPKPVLRLHPNLADLYREKVANLAASLNAVDAGAEAAEAIRALIDEVRLVPEEDRLRIELYGELSALIGLANDNPHSLGTGVQTTLVAGRGFEPLTFRL